MLSFALGDLLLLYNMIQNSIHTFIFTLWVLCICGKWLATDYLAVIHESRGLVGYYRRGLPLLV